jgi:hypothetical protein
LLAFRRRRAPRRLRRRFSSQVYDLRLFFALRASCSDIGRYRCFRCGNFCRLFRALARPHIYYLDVNVRTDRLLCSCSVFCDLLEVVFLSSLAVIRQGDVSVVLVM